MIPDIGKIVALYTEPCGLRNLFIQHKFDFNMAFKYDASKYVTKFDELVYTFNYFPKIMLTGLAIRILQDSIITNIITNIGSNKCITIRKIIILSYRGKNLPIMNIDGLEKYPNLYFFRTRFCEIKNMNVLSICPYITHLDLHACHTDDQIPSESLHKLIMCGFTQRDNKRIYINECPKLQHLNANLCVETLFNTKIKSLVLWNQIHSTFWPNLEFLCVSFANNLINNSFEWHHLKHIIIRCKIIDAKIFDNCQNLITVELYDCNVPNIDSLINRSNINLKIKSHDVNIESFKCGPNKSFRKYMKLYEEWIDHMRLIPFI